MKFEASATLSIATGHELSLALVRNGEVLREWQEALIKGHAEALMPAIESLLGQESGPPGKIIVETGPGSFTGLRVGIAAARALGLAWNVPVRGVRSTLLVAAAVKTALQNVPDMDADTVALVALAAPRGQVWMEPLRLADFHSLAPPFAASVADAKKFMSDYSLVIGSAAPLLREQRVPGGDLAPRAGAVAQLPGQCLGDATPLYVRAPEQVQAA